MRETTRRRLATGGLGLALLVPSLATAQEDAPGLRTRAVEEIVVRARKRSELLEDTPVAVTALGAEALVQQGVQQIDQIQDLVPNLTYVTGPAGSSSSIRIRGVGTSTTGAPFDQGVAQYIDGVFFSRAQGGVLDLVDIQQVEVLRGPQGTLFGKNTVGGAVNIRTRQPGPDLEGSARIRFGNFGLVNTRASINVPLIEDRLFARMAFGSTNHDGYTFNEFRDRRMSNRDSQAFVGSLRFLAAEDLTFDLSGMWTRYHSADRLGQCRVVREDAPLGSDDLFDACRRSRPFRGSVNAHTLSDHSNSGVWGRVEWSPGAIGFLDDLTIRSTAAWFEQVNRTRNDRDGTEVDIVNTAQIDGGFEDGEPGFSRQVQHETQINASLLDERLTIVAGIFTFWEEGTRSNAVETPNLARFTRNFVTIDNWTWAIFSQATADVTDWLSVTGGVRYTEDKKGLSQRNTNVLRPEAPPSLDEAAAQIFTRWTPMASVALTAPDTLLEGTPVDHLMTYFTYARGFKGGGFNGVINPSADELVGFRPETIDNYEVGIKTILFDQMLQANLALFRGNYDDIQVTIQQSFEDENGDVMLLRPTLNAAKATTQGIELELHAQPVEGLTINASFGYLDARYDSFVGISQLDNSERDRSGETFGNAPAFQSFLAIQYAIPLDLSSELFRGWITPRVDWSYRDRYHAGGPEIPDLTQTGYHLLGLRLSYDFWDDRAQVALWTRNLLDETYFRSALPLVTTFGNVVRFHEEPRTYGAEVRVRF